MRRWDVPHSAAVLVLFSACARVPLPGSERDGSGVVLVARRESPTSGRPGKLDPAAWGGDHVGKPVPDYVKGDECLFCHRADVGPSWGANPHQSTVHYAAARSPAVAALGEVPGLGKTAGEVRLLLGRDSRVRFLRRDGYGRLSLLSTAWVPGREKGKGKLVNIDNPEWNDQEFGKSCAGCHATGVDAGSRRFTGLSLDCYVCHGDVTLDHSNDSSKILLARKRKDPARVMVAICAQCHVRGGKSHSTGLPYPNNFVAGDNLFRDFRIDFSTKTLKGLSRADRHVLANVRDVVIRGREKLTCLGCHDVHKQSSKKHRRLSQQEYCLNCHESDEPEPPREPLELHNDICGY